MKETKSAASKKKFKGANFKASLQKEALKAKMPKFKKTIEAKSASKPMKKEAKKAKTPMPKTTKTYLADPHGGEVDYMKSLQENIQKSLKSAKDASSSNEGLETIKSKVKKMKLKKYNGVKNAK